MTQARHKPHANHTHRRPLNLLSYGRWPGVCVRCSTEAQRAEGPSRQQRIAIKAHCEICEICTIENVRTAVADEQQPQTCNHGHPGKHSTTYLQSFTPRETSPPPSQQHAAAGSTRTQRSSGHASKHLAKQQRRGTSDLTDVSSNRTSTRPPSPAAPAQGKGRGRTKGGKAKSSKEGKAPSGNTQRSRGRDLGDPSPLDAPTLGLFYENGHGCNCAYYETELYLANTSDHNTKDWPTDPGKARTAPMRWPSAQSATSTYTHANCQPEYPHPLNSAGFRRDSMVYHHRSEIVTNRYVEELRCSIDKRTASLTEIEESMRLPASHPDAQKLQQALGPNSSGPGNH